jgi:hypothetical protein
MCDPWPKSARWSVSWVEDLVAIQVRHDRELAESTARRDSVQ